LLNVTLKSVVLVLYELNLLILHKHTDFLAFLEVYHGPGASE